MVSGEIILPRGAFGQSVFHIFVSVAPGSRAITRILRGRSSSRRLLVKPNPPCFEGDLRRRSRKRLFGGDGRILHDVPPTFISGNASSCHQENSSEVGIDNLSPRFDWHVLDREIGMGDSGIIDQYVQPTKSLSNGQK